MTEPELFGRPMSSGLAPWPRGAPAVVTSTVTSTAMNAEPEPARRPRLRVDWKFFALAAIMVAVAVAILFMVTTASAADLSARPAAIRAPFTAEAGGPHSPANRS